jgi:HK97 family phage major capsid protein
MLDDAFFNVEDWINSELAIEFAEQEEIAFTSGNGNKKPKVFWPMPHHWMMIKPAHSALFSTFSQALLLV